MQLDDGSIQMTEKPDEIKAFPPGVYEALRGDGVRVPVVPLRNALFRWLFRLMDSSNTTQTWIDPAKTRQRVILFVTT